MQDCVSLRELLVYGDVKGPIAQIRNVALEKIANRGSFGQKDSFPLEAGRLTQAGKQNQAYIHVLSFSLKWAEPDRCQSPDLPPFFCSNLISPIVIVFSSALAMS